MCPSTAPARSPSDHASDVEILSDARRLGILLKGPRRIILEMARRPMSTSEMAERLGETRQRLGYHVRCLVDAGLLEEVDTDRRGAMLQKRYRSSARAYALAPHILGSLAAEVDSPADRESVAHLLGALNQVHADLADTLASRHAPSQRLPTLTLSTRLRLGGAQERAAFAEAVLNALMEVVGRYAAPFDNDDDGSEVGDPFRLTLTLNPTPP